MRGTCFGRRTSVALPSVVILMACAFCRPEDLCNPDLHERCSQSCIGPPAPKSGAIRMTTFSTVLCSSVKVDDFREQSNAATARFFPKWAILHIFIAFTLIHCALLLILAGEQGSEAKPVPPLDRSRCDCLRSVLHTARPKPRCKASQRTHVNSRFRPRPHQGTQRVVLSRTRCAWVSIGGTAWASLPEQGESA